MKIKICPRPATVIKLTLIALGLGINSPDQLQRIQVAGHVQVRLFDHDRGLADTGNDQFAADIGHLADDFAGRLVENQVLADMAAVDVLEKRQLRRAQITVDLSTNRGPANGQDRDRRFNFHVAGWRNRAGDEHKRALHNVDQHGRVLHLVGIEHKLVQHHAGIGRHREKRPIRQAQSEFRTGTRLDHIAQINLRAGAQFYNGAVGPGRRGSAFQILYFANRIARLGSPARLGVLPRKQRASQRLNNSSVEHPTIRTDQGRRRTGGEITLDGYRVAIGSRYF